jgi:hypothetical protein
MGTGSRRIANNWLLAAAKPRLSQNDEKMSKPQGLAQPTLELQLQDLWRG